MVNFADVIESLQRLGFYDYLLPWIFTFAVVYGLLTISKVFGEGQKRIPAAIALVVAFFVTGYGGPVMSAFFKNLFGGATIIIAGILVILLFVAMVGYESKNLKRGGALVILIIVGVILWLLSTGLASGAGYWWLLSPDLIAMLFVLIIIVLTVWLITREDKAEEAKPAGK